MAETKIEWTDLQQLGVGYRENYGGSLESEFPHSHFTFSIEIDRDGMTAKMLSDDEAIEVAHVRTNQGLAADFEQIVSQLKTRFATGD